MTHNPNPKTDAFVPALALAVLISSKRRHKRQIRPMGIRLAGGEGSLRPPKQILTSVLCEPGMTVRDLKKLVKANDPRGVHGMWPSPLGMSCIFDHRECHDDQRLMDLNMGVAEDSVGGNNSAGMVYIHERPHPLDGWDPPDCGSRSIKHPQVNQQQGWHIPNAPENAPELLTVVPDDSLMEPRKSSVKAQFTEGKAHVPSLYPHGPPLAQPLAARR